MKIKALEIPLVIILLFLTLLNNGKVYASSESIPYHSKVLQDMQRVLEKYGASVKPNSVAIEGANSDASELEVKLDVTFASDADKEALLDEVILKLTESIFRTSPTETFTLGPVRYNSSETIEEILNLHEQGDELATMRLAERYKEGRSVTKDMQKACILFGEALARGLPNVYEDILQCMSEGYFTRLDANSAEEVIVIAAQAYNYNAESFLAEHFYNGHYIEENKLRAKTLFEQAEGDGIALNYLGTIYQEGDIVEKDLVKAREYFNDASAKGESLAMYHLANSYSTHESIGIELDLAYYWMNQSALKEYAPAVMEYAKMLLKAGPEFDPLNALIYFKKAHEMGMEDAHCYISEVSAKLYQGDIDLDTCK